MQITITMPNPSYSSNENDLLEENKSPIKAIAKPKLPDYKPTSGT